MLALTYAEGNLEGTVIFDDLDAGKAIGAFTMSFQLLIGGGTPVPAEGLSLFFGPERLLDTFGEEGPADTGSLVISIDTHDNGKAEAPSIDVKYGGRVIASAPYSVTDILSECFSPVIWQLNPNGTLNFNYQGKQVFSNLFIPGFRATAGQFAIGARTEGGKDAKYANHWIDDLAITTELAAPPSAPSVQTEPTPQTVAEHGPVRFTALPSGTPPFTVQWLKDNQPISNATNLVYEITAVAASLDGSHYSVRFQNGQGMATSTAAMLTVIPDATAPTLTSVRGSESFDTVTVIYSEPVTAATAGDKANYALSGGLAVSSLTVRSPTEVRLTTSKQTPGFRYTLTVNGIRDTATTANTIASNSVREFGAFVLARGFLKFEAWNNLPGSSVQKLLDDPRYQAGTPDVVGFISPFDSRSIYPSDVMENYGARISGFVTPSVSGRYRFFTRSVNDSETSLSPDSNPARLDTIAEEPRCCLPFQEPDAAETSDIQVLTANTPYAIQMIYTASAGKDYGQVAWRLEGDATSAGSLLPIPSQFLSVYLDPDPNPAVVAITEQPTSKTAAENTTARFTAAGTGMPAPLIIQWQRAEPGTDSFVDIANARGPTYTTPILKQATDDGAKFRASFRVPAGTSNSSVATLTVIIDSTPPTIAGIKAADNLKGLTVSFSEPVTYAPANVMAHFSIAGLTISSATVVDTTTVQLITSAQTQGQSYTLTVDNVQDSAGNRIVAGANTRSFKAPIVLTGVMKYELFTGFRGQLITDLRASPKFPDHPDVVQLVPAYEGSPAFSQDYGARVKGFFTPATTGDYVFYVASNYAGELYLGTDDTETSKRLIAVEPKSADRRRAWTSKNDEDPRYAAELKVDPGQFAANISLPVHCEAGQSYYTEIVYKVGGADGHGAVKVQLTSMADPKNGSAPSSGATLSTAVDPDLLATLSMSADNASPVGSGGIPGFRVRVNQANQIGTTGLVNFISRAEQQLAGIVDTNAADLTLFAEGGLNVDGVINWNREVGLLGTGSAGTGIEIGSFTSTNTPSYPDQPIPGIPGIGSENSHRADNIAAEIISYIEFPSPGIYFMGVNSVYGFRVTEGDQPPGVNGALVVQSGGVTKSFYAVSGGAEVGGKYRTLDRPMAGKLVLAEPLTAHTSLINGADIAGNIAVISRELAGNERPATKVQNAKDAGAVGVVVINQFDADSAAGKFPVVWSSGNIFVDLPVVMISKPQGIELKALMAAGLTIGVVAPDTSPGLGSFNEFRVADETSPETIFAIRVTQAGVYPFRLVWFNGSFGSGSVEWFTVKPDGTKVLINDTAHGGLAAYRTRTFVQRSPEISLSLDGGNVVLNFKGVLQVADRIGGGFTDVVGATSPHRESAGSPAARFWRARKP